MNIFRLLFKQSFCTRLVLLIRKRTCLLIADLMSINSFKQSSRSQINDVISSFTFLPGPSVSSAVSASENSTPSSAPEIHQLSQISVYCSQLDWFKSTDFYVFTNVIFVSSHFTYCLQPEWSELNNFQFFIETTILTQVSQSDFIEYSLFKWFKSNDFSLNEASANSTQPSFFKFSSFSLDFADCQQPHRSEVNGVQRLYENFSNELNNVY